MDIDCPNALKRCSSAPIINNIIQQTSVMTSTTQQTSPNTTTNRDNAATSIFNILAPRARRYSASFSPLNAINNTNNGRRLTPRVSQLRQEECADISNSREVNHEREIHSALQMSQSWEDLTLVTENWSCKSDDSVTNPLHLNLPIGPPVCSSPSPTRNGLRLPYGLSPSPTRKTFQTRRSMSPSNPIRPSTLGGVKRKCEMDDCGYSHSPPPFKKAFTERGASPISQTPTSLCSSPDSFEGRITPKLFLPKYNNSSTFSPFSTCTSPFTPSLIMEVAVDLNDKPANEVTSTDDNSNEKQKSNEFVSIDDENAKSDIILNSYSDSSDNITNNNNETLLSVLTTTDTIEISASSVISKTVDNSIENENDITVAVVANA